MWNKIFAKASSQEPSQGQSHEPLQEPSRVPSTKKMLSGLWFRFGIVCSLLLIALDQWTKYLALQHLQGRAPIVLLDNILGFRFLENNGAAWGMLGGQRLLLLIAPVIGCGALAYFYFKTRGRNSILLALGIALIFAGGAGNLIDRAFRDGHVVDFIEVLFIQFPVFNVADICVTCGSVLSAIYLLFVEGRKNE
ncbi:MAG: signal peptidase II [Bacillota bacterium]|nr:signal peptidase II [Bacillota bacterium]